MVATIGSVLRKQRFGTGDEDFRICGEIDLYGRDGVGFDTQVSLLDVGPSPAPRTIGVSPDWDDTG